MCAGESDLDALCRREFVSLIDNSPHFGGGFIEEGAGRVPRCLGFADHALSRRIGAYGVRAAVLDFTLGQVDSGVKARSGNAEGNGGESGGEHWRRVYDVERAGFSGRFVQAVRTFGGDKEIRRSETKAGRASQTSNVPFVDDIDFRFGD